MLMANLSHDEWDALIEAERYYIRHAPADITLLRHHEGALRKLLVIRREFQKHDEVIDV